MDKNETKSVPFQSDVEAVTAAISISSIALYGTLAVLGLALSVAVGVLVGYAVRRMLYSSADGDFPTTLLSSSITAASANVTSAFVGITGLERGVFCAVAVAAAFILSRAHSEENNLKATVKGLAGYAIAVTLAGALTELLGHGRVFGVSVPFAGDGYVGIFTSPAGGMMICADTAAVTKYITSKRKVQGSVWKR